MSHDGPIYQPTRNINPNLAAIVLMDLARDHGIAIKVQYEYACIQCGDKLPPGRRGRKCQKCRIPT